MVDGSAGNLTINHLFHRQAFAGEQAFVNGGVAFGDNTVNGNFLPRLDQDAIPNPDLVEGDRLLLTVADNHGVLSLKPSQLFDCRAGFSLGNHLEVFAQSDEDQNQSGALKVEVGRIAFGQLKPVKGGRQAVKIGGGGANEDKGVHIRPPAQKAF